MQAVLSFCGTPNCVSTTAKDFETGKTEWIGGSVFCVLRLHLALLTAAVMARLGERKTEVTFCTLPSKNKYQKREKKKVGIKEKKC